MELSGKSKTFPLTVFQPVFFGFFDHRPRLFLNDRKKVSEFGHNARFSHIKMSQNENETENVCYFGKMTEMSQRK